MDERRPKNSRVKLNKKRNFLPHSDDTGPARPPNCRVRRLRETGVGWGPDCFPPTIFSENCPVGTQNLGKSKPKRNKPESDPIRSEPISCIELIKSPHAKVSENFGVSGPEYDHEDQDAKTLNSSASGQYIPFLCASTCPLRGNYSTDMLDST